MTVNAVRVKFIKYYKKQTYLYPKEYVFKVHPYLVDKVKVGDRRYVRDNQFRVCKVQIMELLELPAKEVRKCSALITPKKV